MKDDLRERVSQGLSSMQPPESLGERIRSAQPKADGSLGSAGPRHSRAALGTLAFAAVLLGSLLYLQLRPGPGPGPAATAGSLAGPGIDFANPLGGAGIPASSAQEAAAALPFRLVMSDTLGPPTKIIVSDATIAKAAHAVAIEYRDPTIGHYWILEEPAGYVTNSGLLAQVDSCRSSGVCEGEWSKVTLDADMMALLVTGPPVTVLDWVEGGVRYHVIGPPDALTGSEATAVGRTLQASIASTG